MPRFYRWMPRSCSLTHACYTPASVWTLIVCNYSTQFTSDKSGHRQSGRGAAMNQPIVFTCCRRMLLSLIRLSEWHFIFSFPLPMGTAIRNTESTQSLPRSKRFLVSGTLFPEFRFTRVTQISQQTVMQRQREINCDGSQARFPISMRRSLPFSSVRCTELIKKLLFAGRWDGSAVRGTCH